MALASVVSIASCVKSCAASVESSRRWWPGFEPRRGPFLGLGTGYSSRSPRPSSSSLAFTSSIDFWPKFRMSMSSDSLLRITSPTELDALALQAL